MAPDMAPGMVQTKRTRWLALGAAVAILAGCASQPDVPAGMARAGQPLSPSPTVPGTMVWRKPGLDPAAYSAFIIPPVKVYGGPDVRFGADTRPQELAAYVGRQFRQTLGRRYSVVRRPGPGVARLQLTLVGTTDNVPVAATASRVTPMGIVGNAVQSAAGGTPTFTGTVTVEGQFVDSQTGEPLATFVTTRAPDPMDLGATLSNQDTHQAAVAALAHDVGNALARSQTASLPKG